MNWTVEWERCDLIYLHTLYPNAEFETSLNTDGDGGEGGEEEDAGTERAGKTSG